LTIMLAGDFDYEGLYNHIGREGFAEHMSELREQRFSFHLKGVKDVFYQVYPSGKVRIDTDDYSDPYTLVQIIVDAACLACKRSLNFKILSLKLLPGTWQRIGAASIRANHLSNLLGDTDEWRRLVAEEATRIKRVHEAIQDLALLAKGKG